MAGYDAIVVGSGPNGLGAAITLARAGVSVCVLERAPSIGGGMRSSEATLPGFIHDECSAVLPMAISSPLFRKLPLQRHGLEWVQPQVPMAHPFRDGGEAVLYRDLHQMERQFPADWQSYRSLFQPLVSRWDQLAWDVLQPVLHVPRNPLLLARFGVPSLRSATGLARSKFSDERLQALFAGSAAHATLPLGQPLTASFGIVLTAVAHAAGWPFARGGTQSLANALASCFTSLGGTIEVSRDVRSFADLPPHRAVLFDVAPERLLDICGPRLYGRYRRSLLAFRRGPAAFKMDYALAGPIPWSSIPCRSAGTVHLGNTLPDMIEAERAVASGLPTPEPFVLVAQPTVCDPSRAPSGCHVAWAYCYLPRGTTADLSEAITARIEQFAPGFRSLIMASKATTPADMESRNANLVRGDISGGSNGGRQLLFRPVLSFNGYRTPAPGVYLCSASTPPGGGVHGMAGYWAARAALRRELATSREPRR